MYYFLSVVIGAIISVMIALNGELTAIHGMTLAAVIIHSIGALFAYIVLKVTRKPLEIKKGIPSWVYLGGVLGVFAIYSNNYAFGKITLTSIIAIVLLGQTIMSLLVDTFGLFGMKKYPFQKVTLIGLAIAAIGMFWMLDAPTGSGVIAVIVSFLAGASIVIARTCNANLAAHVGDLQSAFINHLTGIPVCVLLFALLINASPSSYDFSYQKLWIYAGGLLGVSTVLLFNILVPKIAALPLTLLSFLGQIFASMLIDILFLGTTNFTTLYASLLIALGIALNQLLTTYFTPKNAKTEV